MSFNYIINLIKFLSFFLVFSCGNNEKFSNIESKEDNLSSLEKIDKISLDSNYTFNNIVFEKKFTINNFDTKYEDNLPLKVYIFDNSIFAFNSNTELLRFDLNNGDLLETIKVKIEDNSPLLIPTNFIKYNNKFIVGFKSGIIIMIDVKGNIIWLNKSKKILNTDIKIYEDVLIAIYEDSIKSISLNNGKTNWYQNYEDVPIFQAKGGALVEFAHLIYFILPNNRIGSIDIFLGDKHKSRFDDFEIQSSINNSNDTLHVFDNYLVYFDEGRNIYTFDIFLDEFIINKKNILFSNNSSKFINNTLIVKNSNYLQAINIMSGNIFWKIETPKSIKKADIVEVKILNNIINIFFDNGNVVKISNNSILDILDLKVKNINKIYLQNGILFASHENGKTSIF